MRKAPSIRTKVVDLIAELLVGPSTFKELMVSSKFSKNSLHDWLRVLMECDEAGIPKVVRICAWEKCHRNNLRPVYELNTQGLKSVRRPDKRTKQATLEYYRIRYRNKRAGMPDLGPQTRAPNGRFLPKEKHREQELAAQE